MKNGLVKSPGRCSGALEASVLERKPKSRYVVVARKVLGATGAERRDGGINAYSLILFSCFIPPLRPHSVATPCMHLIHGLIRKEDQEARS